MHIINLKNKLIASLAMLAGVMTSGCTMVTDDLDPCPAQLRIKFVYDYNIKWGDAFLHEVPSVNIWAFDSTTGAFVWSDSAVVAPDENGNFFLEAPLAEGRYDFVAWCGIQNNSQFSLATYTPASKEELEVTMQTLEENGLYTSATRLTPIYHADMTGVEYVINPIAPTDMFVIASLMKDTKDIRVILRNLDGSEIEDREFDVSITVPNNTEYAWNNALMPSETVTYLPWDIRYGVTSNPEDTDISGAAGETSIATLVFDLSTGRLMQNSNTILTIHRKWDDRDLVRINLVDYLLLIKGHYGDISDQEYLDRQDDYSIAFFLDPNSNYYLGGVIFINGWAVVPPQEEEI